MPEVRAVFDYVPGIPRITSIPELERKVNPSPPFWLYDKHVDAKLNLLHVKPMPCLLESLAALADAALKDVVDSDITLPLIGPKSFFFRVSHYKYPCRRADAHVLFGYNRSILPNCRFHAWHPPKGSRMAHGLVF